MHWYPEQGTKVVPPARWLGNVLIYSSPCLLRCPFLQLGEKEAKEVMIPVSHGWGGSETAEGGVGGGVPGEGWTAQLILSSLH